MTMKKGFVMNNLFATYMSLRDPEEEELMQSLLTPTNFGHASFRSESALSNRERDNIIKKVIRMMQVSTHSMHK